MSKITNGSMKLIKSEITDIIYSTIGTDLPNNFDKIDAGVDAVNTRVNNIITTPVDGVSAQEIIDARGGNPTLGNRLDNMQSQTDILQEEVDNLVNVGIPKLVSFDYDIQATVDGQTKFLIPYEYLSLTTDTVEVFVNGIAVPDTYYVITEPVEVESVITLGYVTLTELKPVGTIVKVRILKNVPNGDEGSVDGEIITVDSIPLNRIENHDKIILQDEVDNYNIICNGEFRVNQRKQTTYTENSAYTVDRWLLVNMGRDSIPHGSLSHINESGFNYVRLTGAKDQQLFLAQRLESGYSRMLSNKTVTLSAYVRVQNMTKGNIFIQIAYNGSEDKHPNKFIDYTNLNNEWQRISVTAKLGELLTDIYLQIGTFDDEANGYKMINEDAIIDISYVKFEISDAPSMYVPRNYGEELALCQRYYYSWGNERARFRAVGVNANQLFFFIPLPRTLRTTPTINNAFSINTLSGASVSDFTFAITVVPMGLIVHATKSAHGMTDGQLMLSDNGSLDAEIY